MYRKIEPALRMIGNEATEHYPDNYILIRMVVPLSSGLRKHFFDCRYGNIVM